MTVLGATGYVQDVGTHIERASGIGRRTHLRIYHLLFRGFPWLLFRYGGFLRLAGLTTILFLFGWVSAIASGGVVLVLSLALRSITRRHALIMLQQVKEQLDLNA